MNKTTENFLAAISSYQPPKVVVPTYRLIYDPATGKPTSVTTEDTDQPWIAITREQADAQPQLDSRARVENGRLVIRVKTQICVEEPNQLRVRADGNGNIATDDYSMLIISSKGKNRWTYE